MNHYKPQFDSLRALAVLTVWLTHLWPGLLPFGNGSRFFFILSGFLITSILVDHKSHIEKWPHLGGRGFVLRQFYARRCLRIFPAYYALLLVLLLGSNEFRESKSIWFHVSFMSNVWFATTGNFMPKILSPSWSLAVQEQFYLFWPLLVLWLPRQHLWTAVSFLIVSGLAFKGALLAYGVNEVAVCTLTPGPFTALGFGALLALVRERPRAQAIIHLLGMASVLAIIAKISAVRLGALGNAPWMTFLMMDTLYAVALTALLSKLASGVGEPVGPFLALAPLRYLGRMSFGLYLYHMPALLLVLKVCHTFDLPEPSAGPMRLFIVGMITVPVAAFSWHFLEEPINQLKRFFPYQRARVFAQGLVPA
jgi:peptidoglycan/LPS O-acetylase OafA/YrhL